MPGRSALVIGAGVGGLSAAISLRRQGIDVRVCEQAPELQPLGAGLTLWPNAVHALRRLGLADELRRAQPVRGEGGIRSWSGELLAVTSADELERRYGAPMLVLHRAELQRLLLDALGTDRVRLGARLVGFEQGGRGVTAHFAGGAEERADLLVGADGIASTVRADVVGDGPPRYSGYVAWRAVTEFRSPVAGESWGPGSVFGLVPLADGRLYWFATKPAAEREPAGEPKGELLERFSRWHAPIAAVIAATDEGAILRHPVVDRKPVRGWSRGRVTLLGDAAHPMTPHLGQGACQALEDAVVLGDCLSAAVPLPEGLRAYEARRYARTAALVERSRRAGRLAQAANPLARAIRDAALKRLPPQLRLAELDLAVGSELG